MAAKCINSKLTTSSSLLGQTVQELQIFNKVVFTLLMVLWSLAHSDKL